MYSTQSIGFNDYRDHLGGYAIHNLKYINNRGLW